MGEQKAKSSIEEAMRVGRVSVGLEEDEREKGERKVLLRGWKKEETG